MGNFASRSRDKRGKKGLEQAGGRQSLPRGRETRHTAKKVTAG